MYPKNLARRRYQRGSLWKDVDRWKARWRVDVLLPDGTVKRVYRERIIASLKQCRTRRLAQRMLDEILSDINREDYQPTSLITFKEFAKKWMGKVLIHQKGSSQSSTASLINVHLVPAFGSFALNDIGLEMIQGFVNQCSKSPKTIKNIIGVFMVMWDTARAWNYATHNPFPRTVNGRLLLKLPRVVKGNTYNFSIEETLAIINAAHGWKKVFFQVLAETGMRPGELAGLRIVDVGPHKLKISQSIWQCQVQTPKTKTAERMFAISAQLEAVLRLHIEDMKKPIARYNLPGGKPIEQKNPLGLVFPAESGRPLSMDNFRNRTLKPILKKLEILEKIKAAGVRGGNYAFRHMNATIMDQWGVPLKTRQKRLGHAQIETTLTHYTHPIDAEDYAVADKFGALLERGTPRKTVDATGSDYRSSLPLHGLKDPF